MKKQFKFLTVLFIALLMLVGCNTAKEQNTSESPSASEGTNTNATTDNIAKNEDEEEQPTTDETTENETQSITYTSNGVEKTEETTIVHSDEQQYSLQILPGFTLTAEEPGKDLLYLTENGSISMRIEQISVNDQTFEGLLSNTEEMMNAVDETVKPTDFDIQPYVNLQSDIVDYKAFKVDLVDHSVSAIIYEKNQQLVRLTIFDNPSMDLTDAMIKMGLSITNTN